MLVEYLNRSFPNLLECTLDNGMKSTGNHTVGFVRAQADSCNLIILVANSKLLSIQKNKFLMPCYKKYKSIVTCLASILLIEIQIN